jgi:hypothetical protein
MAQKHFSITLCNLQITNQDGEIKLPFPCGKLPSTKFTSTNKFKKQKLKARYLKEVNL